VGFISLRWRVPILIHVLPSTTTKFYQLCYYIPRVFRNIQLTLTELIKGFFCRRQYICQYRRDLGHQYRYLCRLQKRYLGVTNHFLISRLVRNFGVLDLTVVFLRIYAFWNVMLWRLVNNNILKGIMPLTLMLSDLGLFYPANKCTTVLESADKFY
jgi:hypothetical protein